MRGKLGAAASTNSTFLWHELVFRRRQQQQWTSQYMSDRQQKYYRWWENLDFDVTRQTYIELIRRDKLEEWRLAWHQWQVRCSRREKKRITHRKRPMMTYGTEFVEADLAVAVLVRVDDRLRTHVLDKNDHERLSSTLSTICCNCESFRLEPTIIFNTWNNSPAKKRMFVFNFR